MRSPAVVVSILGLLGLLGWVNAGVTDGEVDSYDRQGGPPTSNVNGRVSADVVL